MVEVEFLTFKEYAKKIGKSLSRVYQLSYEGKIKTVTNYGVKLVKMEKNDNNTLEKID